MKRLTLILITLILLSLACNLEGANEPLIEGHPPTVAPIVADEKADAQQEAKTVIYSDDFDANIGAWFAVGEAPTEASLELQGQALVANLDVAESRAAVVGRVLADLPSPADGITLMLEANERAFNLVVGANEADGSRYTTFFVLRPEESVRTIDVDFDWMGLELESEDENGQLDSEQIEQIYLLDLSSYTGPTGPGRIVIHSLDFWQGQAALLTRCQGEQTAAGEFLVGVDASFIPEGEGQGEGWFVGEQRVDPLALIAAQGGEALRLRVWVGENGPSKRDYASDLAARAHGLGMQVYPVLFLSEDWADVGKQPAPAEWSELPLTARAEAIRSYSRETVAHLLETGIRPPYYEIGNEIDYGISGVFAEFDQRHLSTLQTSIWPQQAILLQAAIEGVRQADPEARIMLHIAQAYDPLFSRAFYRSMQDLGVEYDIAGLSFYPSALGPMIVGAFCQTIELLGNELGLPAVVAEFAYPGEIPGGGPFGNWRNTLPGYPLTQDGQGSFLADFLADMRAHPNVIGAYYFSPAFHWGGELWGPFALFDAQGRARPALGALTRP